MYHPVRAPILKGESMNEEAALVGRHAYELMAQGYSCSEATLLAVGEHLWGQVDPGWLRLSTGFAGGVGGTEAELCGALSGGVIVIGALHGRSDPTTDRTRCKALIKAYRDAFLAEFGTTCCGALRAEGGYGSPEKPCRMLVERAVTLLMPLLDE